MVFAFFVMQHLTTEGNVMANTFSLILVLVTLFTGVIWAIDKFVWAPKRKQKIAAAREQANGQVDEATLEKVAPQPAWIEQSVSIFPVIGIVLVLRSFIYEKKKAVPELRERNIMVREI